MIILTERLYLRPWREDDAEDLYRYASDPDIGLSSGWQPHTDVENSRKVILEVLSAKETYAVCLKEDCLPIGCVCLSFERREKEPYPDGECELGFWIGKPFWGQHLIPEAATAMLRRAFEELRMDTVWCAYFEGNEKSKRTQERMGFVMHHTNENEAVPMLGEVRTVHYNVMTKERWQELRDDVPYLEYQNPRRKHMKTAIVYYSMSGNTEMVANRLADALGADLIRLIPETEYPTSGVKKFFWGGKSAVMGEAPPLQPYTFNAAAYDRIIFGTPVWASTFTPPLRTFIQDNREALKGKRFAVFACQSGSGAEKAVAKLQKELGIAAFDEQLILIDPKTKENREYSAAIEAFCAALA